MRIIAGKRRGLVLSALGKGDPGAHLRPTSDRVRECIFDLLLGGRFGDPVSNARVLDLFAGTGALGLEAWSRGAKTALCVDNGQIAGKLISENIARASAKDEVSLLRTDATSLPKNTEDGFDLIFLDPPYGQGLGQQAILNGQKQGWFTPNATIVWEEGDALFPPAGFELFDQRRYGDTHVTILSPV